MAQLTTQPRGLLTLTDSLLTQAEQGDALAMATVTGRPGGGLVVSGTDSLQLVEHLKFLGYRAPLLADRQRYKGKRRKLASEPFDPAGLADSDALDFTRSSRMLDMLPQGT